jgi:pimeloyl-ACP methyl ester carboxylesterase
MPNLRTAGASVFYALEGSGPPLLLLAGIASDNASWGPLVPLLRERFQLIMMDNRGSGRTQSPGVLNIIDMVDDCVMLLDHLHIGRATVVGHSLGGMIGHRLAAFHPGRVERLVTMTCANAIAEKERTLFKDLARLYARVEPALWFRLLYHWLFAAPSFYREEAIAAAADASVAYPYRQSPMDFARQVDAIDRMRSVTMEAVRCPVLGIAGERDVLIPPAAMAEGHARVGIFEMVTVPGAGHSVHWEAPQAVADAIVGFASDRREGR